MFPSRQRLLEIIEVYDMLFQTNAALLSACVRYSALVKKLLFSAYFQNVDIIDYRSKMINRCYQRMDSANPCCLAERN